MTSQRFVIRVDASLAIGTGHVMRSIVLAEYLRSHGGQVVFLSRELPGNLIGRIAAAGFLVEALPSPDGPVEAFSATGYEAWLGLPWADDADQCAAILGRWAPDWLIVDHYAIDRRWQEGLADRFDRLLVLDDLANRPHVADALLEQSYSTSGARRYDRLVPSQCRVMCGPRQVFLRAGLRSMGAAAESDRAQPVRRILVFFGGVDATDQTSKAIDALATLDLQGIAVDVVIGSAHPARQALLRRQGVNPWFRLHVAPENFDLLLASSDLCIGAGGVSAWERFFLQLPSIALAIAANQVDALSDAQRDGLLCYLGPDRSIFGEDLAAAVSALLHDPERRRFMQMRMRDVMGPRAQASDSISPELAGIVMSHD